MSKPREFWLLKNFVQGRPNEYSICIDWRPEVPMFFDSLHVIEKSAADKLVDSIELAIKGINNFPNRSGGFYGCDCKDDIKEELMSEYGETNLIKALKEYRGED